MKKLASTLLLATFCATTTSVALASPKDKNKPYKMQREPLNLTSEEAQTIVQAGIIKHGQADNAVIEKTQTIKLDGNKTFYMVYVGAKNQSTANKFFIVDAQNGHVQMYPKPKFKHKNRPLPPQALQYQMHQPQQPMPVMVQG
ncbi:hypothetical protein L3V82_00220 [Thiotrichales bacterium 19S3-7]|nr:hypothetical protein [Thiotrichales bacterium 19S3-7]MCF6800588.1 hypothetical protein [Thiotrichales bacterium 19S3-11]